VSGRAPIVSIAIKEIRHCLPQASLSAIANDGGTVLISSAQLIAHARRSDVAIAIE
jgi:phosphoheptose isomerase